MGEPFQGRCLLVTYVGGRKKTRVVGGDGHFCAVIARLVEDSVFEFYKYVRILFKSGIEVPVMVLRLWSGAMGPRNNLPPFLLKMDGLMSIKHNSGRGLSKVVGLKLTQLGGLYMENPFQCLR